MLRDEPYAGGFLLSRKSQSSVAHFSAQELPGGWTLWTDDCVATQSHGGEQGVFIIRGHWADLSDQPTKPGELARELWDLANSDEEALHERLAKVAGRYIVIWASSRQLWIYHDTLGLRSVYYSTTSALVSSHLHLIQSLEPRETVLTPQVALTAWDFSIADGVHQLLPNYRLHPADARVERYFPTQPNRYLGLTPSERLQRVEELWHRELDSYARTHPRTVISVTGGLDSRLMLAMAKDHLHQYRGFTYGVRDPASTRWSQSLSRDRTIVSQLLPHLPLSRHDYIDLDEKPSVPSQLRTLIRRNSWTSHGHYLIPAYRSLFPDGDWLHLRGTGVEVIRRYWPRHPARSDYQNVLSRLTRPGSPDLRPRSRELGYEEHLFGYELMDLAYWEVRMGKWHSELLNESDAAFDTFVPIATREIFELLLAFDTDDRESGLAVRELINRNFPVLNFIGANDSRNLYEQMRDEARTSRHKLTGHVLMSSWGQRLAYVGHSEDELFLPHEHFVAGNHATAIIATAERAGTLQLTVRNGYYYPPGRGTFKWSLLVGNDVVASCDGADWRLPVRITVQGVQSGQDVKLRLTALKTRQSESWQRASVTTVSGVQFLEATGVVGVVASSDCPAVTTHAF